MSQRLQRRSFLGLGLSAGAAWAASARGAVNSSGHARTARAKQVLIVLEQGGLSHIDTWDPKPDAVAEHRSPFKPISTSVPGLQLTELFAKTALHVDKLAIVRSMHHRQTGHGEGTQYHAARREPGGPLAMPDLGTGVAHLLGSECGYLPPYVMVPGNHEQAAVTSARFSFHGVQSLQDGRPQPSRPELEDARFLAARRRRFAPPPRPARSAEQPQRWRVARGGPTRPPLCSGSRSRLSMC